MSDIRDIFISYVEEDSSIAVELAQGLEKLGYTTWYYGRDSKPGMSYLIQTRYAINDCRAVALIITDHSLTKAKQVDKEVVHSLESDKAFLPILVNIAWTEFQKRQPAWAQAIGGIVGISITEQGVPAMMPRLAAGLKGLGILPQENKAASQITRTYPLPLAAAYAQRMTLPSDPQQAFQVHTFLGDMAEAVIKTLAVLVLSYYRQQSLSPGKEDSEVEKELQILKTPQLEGWVSLLHSTLSLYGDAPHPLLAKIHALFYEKQHRKDAVSKAAASLVQWMNLPVRKPPVSFQDLFELMAQYRNHTEGWAASGAIKSPPEYLERVEVLRAALEFSLVEMEFLTSYRLIFVQKAGSTPGAYRILDATGRDFTPVTEDFRSNKPLEAGHTVLCQKEAESWLPFLDLFPLVVVQECKGCKQNRLFFLSVGSGNRQEYASPACSHRVELSEITLPNTDLELSAFLGLGQWRSRAETPAQGNYAPYLSALREVLQNAEVDPQERDKLIFLAKMLRIPPETAARLEAQVLEELIPVSIPELIPELIREIPPPPVEPVVEKRLVVCWQQATTNPVARMAIFGSPTLLFVCDDDGTVQVFNEQQQMVFEDRLEGRPYQLTTLEDRVLISTWKGYLYCFGSQELLWQSALGSPLSALAVSTGSMAVAVGGWDGKIHVFNRDGAALWKTRLDDGISALALSPNGQHLAVGTYAGQLCVLVNDAQKLWLQDGHSPVGKVEFTHNGQDLIIARRDRMLLRMNAENQTLLWDFSLEKPPLDFAISANDRRLIIANREGDLLVYSMDGNPNLRNQYTLTPLNAMAILPFSSEGNFILALSTDGVALVDNRNKTQTVEVSQFMKELAVSTDGKMLALGGTESVSLFRLGRPQLLITLEPLGKLSKSRFTRLRISLHNTGERLARHIEVTLEGPIDCKPTGLPGELKAGETVSSDKQSLQPLADGALPIYVHFKYSDDFGILHEHTDRLVLESAESESPA